MDCRGGLFRSRRAWCRLSNRQFALVDKAIQNRNRTKFGSAYAELTTAGNVFHQAAAFVSLSICRPSHPFANVGFESRWPWHLPVSGHQVTLFIARAMEQECQRK